MVVIGLLRRMRQEVTAYRVDVQGTRAETHPKVFTEITVEHVIEGRRLDASAIRQALSLADSKYCPVVIMVGQAARLTHTYHLIDVDTGQAETGAL